MQGIPIVFHTLRTVGVGWLGWLWATPGLKPTIPTSTGQQVRFLVGVFRVSLPACTLPFLPLQGLKVRQEGLLRISFPCLLFTMILLKCSAKTGLSLCLLTVRTTAPLTCCAPPLRLVGCIACLGLSRRQWKNTLLSPRASLVLPSPPLVQCFSLLRRKTITLLPCINFQTTSNFCCATTKLSRRGD